MPRLWAQTVTFDSVLVGDQLPILVKLGTEDAICSAGVLLKPGTTTEAAALIGKVDPPAPDLTAYLLELLEKGFPIETIQGKGSSLKIESLRPVNSRDTLSLTGRVVGKREQGDLKVVTCRMVVENKEGQILAEASAEVCL